MPGSTVTAIVRCLQDPDDSVVRHYAAKTLENILALSGPPYATRFATQETALHLIDALNKAKLDAERATCATALANLFAHACLGCAPARAPAALLGDEGPESPASSPPAAPFDPAPGARMLARVAERLGADTVLDGLDESNVRLRTAYLNLFNLIFLDATGSGGAPGDGTGPGSGTAPAAARSAARAALAAKHIKVMAALTRCAEHAPSTSLRAKAVVGIHLLCAAAPAALAAASERRLLPILTRLLTKRQELDEAPALLRAAVSLARFLSGHAARAARNLAAALEDRAASGVAAAANSSGGGGPLAAAIKAFPPVLHVVNSPCLRWRAVTPAFVRDVSTCARILAGAASRQGSSPGSSSGPRQGGTHEACHVTLCVLEAMTQHGAVLLARGPVLGPCASHFVPAVCSLLDSRSGDTRVLGIALLRASLPALARACRGGGEAFEKLSAAVAGKLLPRCEYLLGDADPLPAQTLRLVVDCGAWRGAPAAVAKSQKLLDALAGAAADPRGGGLAEAAGALLRQC